MTDANSPSRRALLGGALALSAAGVAQAAGGSSRGGSDGLVVQTKYGRLRGKMEDGARVFKGIPYAEAPVGPLRFRPPQPPKSWTGIREATSFGNSALQGTPQTLAHPKAIPASEDCLFLNVWAPATPGPHPVLLWLHAGGNNGGNGSIGAYNGHAFARDGVVLITINWRIGMMGFLELGEHLPEYAGSGNNALRDHIAALTWVRDNIAAFGGDPQNVTLGGVLGGGRNVVALLAAPAASGLFHKCIAQSTGGYTYHTPFEARRVGRLGVDAHTGDARDLLTATPAELVVATSKARWSYSKNTPWRAIADGSLVPTPPVPAFAAGASKNIPLLIGMNRDESPSNLPADFSMQKIFPVNSNELQAMDLTSFNSIAFRYERAFPNLAPIDRRYRLITGEEYIIPTLRMLDAREAAGGSAPTYLFRFDNALSAGRYKGYTISGLDVHYQFENLGIDGKQEVVTTEGVFSPEDHALARTVHTAWVNFVKTGKPTSPGLPDWTPYDSERRQTMLLNHESRMADDPWRDERVLWHDVFPI